MASHLIELSIPNTLAGVEAAIDTLSDRMERLQVPPPLVHAAQTVADELLSNAIRHGYRDRALHTIDVRLLVGDGELTLGITDDGVPFDPFAWPAPDLTVPVGDRPTGGLGIHLVRQLSVGQSYTRADGRNHVSVVLRLASE